MLNKVFNIIKLLKIKFIKQKFYKYVHIIKEIIIYLILGGNFYDKI